MYMGGIDGVCTYIVEWVICVLVIGCTAIWGGGVILYVCRFVGFFMCVGVGCAGVCCTNNSGWVFFSLTKLMMKYQQAPYWN